MPLFSTFTSSLLHHMQVHGQQQLTQVSALIYFHLPERKSHCCQAIHKHGLLGWDTWLGPVCVSESLSMGSPPSGYRLSFPCLSSCEICSLTQTCLAVVDTQRTLGFTGQHWPLSPWKSKFPLKAGTPFKGCLSMRLSSSWTLILFSIITCPQ